MTDRRTVDELTTEELEQVLIAKRREARAERMRRLRGIGRLPPRLPCPARILPPSALGAGRQHEPGYGGHRERVFDLDPLRGKEQRKRQGGRSRRTRWARFRHLDKLALGDELTVYAGEHPYRHAVTIKRIVGPSGVSVLMPTARLVVTLISCYPYMVDTQCIVIVAELQ